MKKVELLAPAGSYESFLGAIHAGADAVYIGGQKYGARAYAENFTEEEVCLAIRYAHLFGKKVYLTVNTLLRESELAGLPEYMRPFYEEGLDGVIVQDMGVFSLLRECFPSIELHASTQMTVTGARGARFLLEQGASRVVPARELSLEEIKEIKKTGIEVEAFIHGAMCYCYSGQCLLSSMLGGRSGNRGRCAQPCRLPYQIPGLTEGDCYPLSLKDMCTLAFLPELIEAGIDSFKIEGRMKKPEYAAGVTALYRKYIDRYYAAPSADYQVEKADMERLRTLYIRSEIQEGYYHRHNGREMITPEKPSYGGTDERYLQEIRAAYLEKKQEIPVSGHAVLKKGSPVMLELTKASEGQNGENGLYRICCSGQEVQQAQKQPLTKEAVEKQLFKTGNTAFVFGGLTIELEDDCFLPVKALNDLRREAFAALEDGILQPYRRDDANIPEKDEKPCRKAAENSPCISVQVLSEEQLAAVCRETFVDRLYIDGDMSKQQMLQHWKQEKKGRELFLVLPAVIRLRDEHYLEEIQRELSDGDFDGVMVRNLEGLCFLWETGFSGKIMADTGLYVWNSYARQFFEQLGVHTSAPLECNKKDWHTLGLTDMEVVVYGRSMLMVTANCLRKTVDKCLLSDKKAGNGGQNGPEMLLLRDRYKTEFPVRTVCRHCYNEIYNSVPLSLHEYGKSIMEQRPGSIRLVFTTESSAQISEVLDCYRDFAKEPARQRTVSYAFTKGHYKRGAE